MPEGRQMDLGGIEAALGAVGALLDRAGQAAAIVVAGGAALALQRLVTRVTSDVDVLCLADPSGELLSPEPFPAALQKVIATVGRDFGLPANWMNNEVGRCWTGVFPDGMADRLHWSKYETLRVGLLDRLDLIHLKLWASADSLGPESVHFQDLLALEPSDDELERAHTWVLGQDGAELWSKIIEEVLAHARDLLGRS